MLDAAECRRQIPSAAPIFEEQGNQATEINSQSQNQQQSNEHRVMNLGNANTYNPQNTETWTNDT